MAFPSVSKYDTVIPLRKGLMFMKKMLTLVLAAVLSASLLLMLPQTKAQAAALPEETIPQETEDWSVFCSCGKDEEIWTETID